MVAYILIFFRMAIGLIFLISALGKLRDFSGFTQTINRFQILPKTLYYPFAWLFISCEIVVIILLAIGKQFLIFGFMLANLLLLTFSLALLSVLIRNISTPCNCFGYDSKPVSLFDLARNIIFVLCAMGGWTLYTGGFSGATPNLFDWILIGFAAFAFVMVIINLGEIVKVLDSV